MRGRGGGGGERGREREVHRIQKDDQHSWSTHQEKKNKKKRTHARTHTAERSRREKEPNKVKAFKREMGRDSTPGRACVRACVSMCRGKEMRRGRGKARHRRNQRGVPRATGENENKGKEGVREK